MFFNEIFRNPSEDYIWTSQRYLLHWSQPKLDLSSVYECIQMEEIGRIKQYRSSIVWFPLPHCYETLNLLEILLLNVAEFEIEVSRFRWTREQSENSYHRMFVFWMNWTTKNCLRLTQSLSYRYSQPTRLDSVIVMLVWIFYCFVNHPSDTQPKSTDICLHKKENDK